MILSGYCQARQTHGGRIFFRFRDFSRAAERGEKHFTRFQRPRDMDLFAQDSGQKSNTSA